MPNVPRDTCICSMGPIPSSRYGLLLPHEKDTLIADLEQRCYFAENRLLQAEMRLSKVMVQIYRDSPSLSRCLMLSNSKTSSSVSGSDKGDVADVSKFQTLLETTETSKAKIPEKAEKAAPDVADKWSSSSVQKQTRISEDELSQSSDVTVVQSSEDKLKESKFIVATKLPDGKNESPVQTFGGALPMLDKLTLELWKTKAELLAVLQEKETTRNNASLLDIKEYEEIINQLQEDLLLLMCQYTEVRQALQTEHPEHIVHTIGQLQDKVRKQEKIIRLQQSQLQSLKSDVKIASSSGSQEETKTADQQSKGENSTTSNPHPGSNERNRTGSLKHTEVTSQLIEANEQIRYMKEELLSAKNVINNLRSKCQMLGEQHEQTLLTLDRMGKLNSYQPQVLYQKYVEELMAARQQLKESKQRDEFLITENKELRSLCESQKKVIINMEESHKEKIAEYQHEKTLSERNFQLLSERHSDALAQLQTWRSYFQEAIKRQNMTNMISCAQEMASPLKIHTRLTEMGLLVDGAKSMDAESSLFEPKEEEQTLSNLIGQASLQKEVLEEKLSENVQQVDSDENCAQLNEKPLSSDEKSGELSDKRQQEQSSSDQGQH